MMAVNAASIPEPSAAALLVASCIFLIHRRYNRRVGLVRGYEQITKR